MTVDPFTAASPSYRAATRLPFKTGSAFEVHDRRWPYGLRVAWIAGTSAVLWLGAALALYVGVCCVREVLYAFAR